MFILAAALLGGGVIVGWVARVSFEIYCRGTYDIDLTSASKGPRS